MKQTRRDFLRGTIGWGGLLLAGSFQLAASHSAEPVRKAGRFFAARQSADGAWRSTRYAAFREGDVLTPVVLWAMQAAFERASVSGRVGFWAADAGVPSAASGEVRRDAEQGLAHPPAPTIPLRHLGGQDAHPTRECYTRGWQWLREFTDATNRRENPWTALRYPLFTASYSAQVLARGGDVESASVWVKMIEALRTSAELGWPVGDVQCGAWSDASSPPRYVAPVPDMLAPNISATALALEAFGAAGCGAHTAGARPFIERCQNFSESHPERFDDGGFFFALDDPVRNKAGTAGRDAGGHLRFRSYGSATCDGFLALRACGVPLEHPRVQAAADWLRLHCDGLLHGGNWPDSRAEARASLAFYQSQALAAVLADLPAGAGWPRKLRESVVTALVAAQSSEGHWQGLASDSCEDEPLLASAFALRALSLLA